MTAKLGDKKLADQVINAYSTNMDGLIPRACSNIGIDQTRCQALQKVLGRGKEGVVTNEERTELKKHFSDQFINELAGTDGKRALQERVKWLSQYAVFRSLRWHNKSLEERRKIVRELGDIGSHAEDAIPSVKDILSDCDLIAKIKKGSPTGRSLSEPNEYQICIDATDTLAKIGSASIPTLLEATKNADVNVRIVAIRALGRLGKNDGNLVLPALTKALTSEDKSVREAAAYALCELGSAGVPALVDALKNNHDSTVKRIAAYGLGNIKSKDAVDALALALSNPDWQIHWSAIAALIKTGAAAIPILERELYNDKNKYNGDKRRSVVVALREIGRPASDALIKALNHWDSSVRMIAAGAIGEWVEERAISALESIVKYDYSPGCVKAAKEALDKINAKRKTSK